MARRDSKATVHQERFIVDYGWRVPSYQLEAILGLSKSQIDALRCGGALTKHTPRKSFAELFSLWHGRPPVDEDWPAPPRSGVNSYAWLPPEEAYLASLVGRLSVAEIAGILTTRLRKITGDPEAERSRVMVNLRINRLGLVTSDVVGGITASQAGREIGAYLAVHQAIEKGELKAFKVGRLQVIGYEAWAAWKKKRVFPPKGFVRLSTYKEPLSIKSDKLSEFARMGYIPTAIRCRTYGVGERSTQYGTWWIDPKAGEKLVADRRAGRPMPWHGKANRDNQKVTYALWLKRKHPETCQTCAIIWGADGPPKDFEEYLRRYPPLAHGAKRHLTLKWNPGFKVSEVAEKVGCPIARVRRAIANGALVPNEGSRPMRLSKTEISRWQARNLTTGDSPQSWLLLTEAERDYLFTQAQLRRFIKQGKLKTKRLESEGGRKVIHVPRHQCILLREQIGFTEEEAARRAGVSVARFLELVKGVNWRGATGIPLSTVQAAIKRLESHEGYTLEEAANELGVSVDWIQERRRDGTIHVSRTAWDRRRIYIPETMMRRLHKAKKHGPPGRRLGNSWLGASAAASDAGVSTATLYKWAENGDLVAKHTPSGWRYARYSVRRRARRYWKTVRFHRATPPQWLTDELETARSGRA